MRGPGPQRDAFGEAYTLDENAGGSAFVQNVRFPGQYFDGETGLHYNMHRYYDPSVGRYISADPIGQAGGVNVYRYVNNNPVQHVDPLGLAEGYGSRVYQNFVSTNKTIPGIVAPPFAAGASGISGNVAASRGVQTALGLAGTALTNPATLTAAAVAGTAKASAVAWFYAGLAWEGGVLIGSLVSEAPVIGGGTVGDFWGALLFGAYQDFLCWVEHDDPAKPPPGPPVFLPM